MFFSILDLGWDWLKVAPDQWENFEDFRKARDFAMMVKVTNDLAERGIKMISDFANFLTKNDETMVELLQGVELNRKAFPKLKKNTLNSPN